MVQSVAFYLRTASLVVGISTAICFFSPAQAATVTFFATLGNFENPPTGSPGTGSATVIMDVDANTLSIECDLPRPYRLYDHGAYPLLCCTAGKCRSGDANTLVCWFSLRRNVRKLFQNFNTALASTWNRLLSRANGGTAAGAEAVLFAGLLAGRAYFNIHTSTSGGGEIRGFLNPVPVPAALPLFASGLGLMGLLAWRQKAEGSSSSCLTAPPSCS